MPPSRLGYARQFYCTFTSFEVFNFGKKFTIFMKMKNKVESKETELTDAKKIQNIKVIVQ